MTAVSNRKILKKSMLFALLLSLAITFGHAIYTTNSLAESWPSASRALLAVATAAVLFAVLSSATFLTFKLSAESDDIGEKGIIAKFIASKKGFFTVWAAVFLCYLPCFLAYYPGFMSYDIVGQDVQASTHAYTNFHPPIHTFIWEICIYLEGIIGLQRVSIYELIQMLALSYAVSRMMSFMAKRSAPGWLLVVSFLFLAVNPLCAMISLIPAKDVYCAVFFMLLTMSVADLISSPYDFLHDKKKMSLFIIEALLFSLFRNNAIYAVAVAAVILWAAFKGNRTRIAVLFIIPTLAYYLVNGWLYDALGVSKVDFIEVYNVPIQQIAFTVSRHPDEIPEDVEEEIRLFIPGGIEEIAKTYNPRIVDPMKKIIDMSYGVKPLVRIWFKLLVRYPVDYLSAFLDLNLQSWYLPAKSMDPYSGRLLIETVSTEEELLVPRESFFPKLLAYYSKTTDCSGAYGKMPLCVLTSIALPIWIAVFFMTMSSMSKNIYACFYVIPVLFWMTYLLGPVSNFRYMVPIYLQCPLLVFAGLYPQRCFEQIKKSPK